MSTCECGDIIVFDYFVLSNDMLRLIYNIILVPPLRYPEKWKPAFLAMQLGFIAGGLGLLGRDLLFYFTVQNWQPLVLSELFFASFIFAKFSCASKSKLASNNGEISEPRIKLISSYISLIE